MRLLALASWCTKDDWNISFCGKVCDKKLINKIENRGFNFFFDEQPFENRGTLLSKKDILVMDDYNISKEEWYEISNLECTTVLLDDATGDYPLPVDVVVNPAPNFTIKDYRKRSENSILLLGPKFTVLKKTFSVMKIKKFRQRAGVLITLGGSDHRGLEFSLTKSLCSSLKHEKIVVVLGPMIKDDTVRRVRSLMSRNPNLTVLVDCSNIESHMANVSVGISSGGSTLGELAATGTPTVAICTTPNQSLMLTSPLRNTWYIAHDASLFKNVSVEKDKKIILEISKSVRFLLENDKIRKTMENQARSIVDGFGCKRILETTFDLHRTKMRMQ
ncbi:hypothetical protein pfor_3c0330 [Rhodobacteraceae bacterium SB2]|nr:hypothetical protein pfor_3c0330 [Rhodobacteraceae bacterium SB2]